MQHALPRAAVRLVLSLAIAAGLLAIRPATAAEAAPDLHPASAGDGYTSLPPARVLDTRPGTATIDGQFAGGGAVERFLDLPVAGRGGVPASGAIAVSLNITVTGPTAASFLTAWPTGQPLPNASNINFSPGQTVANAAIVQLGDGGRVSLFNETGTTDLVIDVVGWFASDADYHPHVPARILDTRPDGRTIDGFSQGSPGIAGFPQSVQVAWRAGVPADARAVVLNVTVVAPTQSSFATVWPYGEARPNASNLNYEAGRNVANLVVAEVGAQQRINIQYEAGTLYVIADVVGWFGTDEKYAPVLPARLLDTRSANATIDGLHSGGGPVGPGGRIDLQVAGRGGVPAFGVDAVVVNVTATQPTSGSFVTAWPTGDPSPPNASTLNVVPGRTVPNLAIVQLGAGGEVSLFNEQGQTHLIVDVVGWFPSSLDIADGLLRPAVAGTPFSQTLSATRSVGGVAWAFLDAAPGLSGSADGVVSGTPTTPGTYSTVALVADSASGLAARVLPHHIFSPADGYAAVTPLTMFDSFATPAELPFGSHNEFVGAGTGGVPADALAVVVNIVIRSSSGGFLMAWPDGAAPDVASVVAPARTRVENTIVVPLNGLGRFQVETFGALDYSMQLVGYFGSTSAYHRVGPFRAADSRIPYGFSGKMAPGSTTTIQLTGSNLPSSARSVILSVIATGASGSGALDVVAAGVAPPAPPTFDFDELSRGQTVVVPISAGGAVDVRNRAGGAATDVIVDVLGYFE